MSFKFDFPSDEIIYSKRNKMVKILKRFSKAPSSSPAIFLSPLSVRTLDIADEAPSCTVDGSKSCTTRT